MQLRPGRGRPRGSRGWASALVGVAVFGIAPAKGADREEATRSVRTPSSVAVEDTATKRASLEVAAYEDSDHVGVFTPSLAAGIENVSGASLHAAYLVDVVSAASVDIVSTASPRWDEVRHAGSVSFDYKPHDFGVGLGGSVSSEPDYLSYGGHGQILHDFDEKNWTLIFGAGVTQDTIGRCGGTDGCTPFDVFSRKVLRGTLSWGLSVAMDPASLASVSLDLMLESGDQSKPYRYVPMFSPAVVPTVTAGADVDWVNANRLPERPLEQLPLTRKRVALTARYARRMGATTLRLLERGYYDTWGMLASSTDVRLLLDLGRRFAVGPHGRFHLQRAVSFWKLAYVSGRGWDLPLHRTGDRELGPLWTATGGLGLKWYIGAEPDPTRLAIDLSADGMYTAFLDTLYILNRTAVLGALGVEAAF